VHRVLAQCIGGRRRPGEIAPTVTIVLKSESGKNRERSGIKPAKNTGDASRETQRASSMATLRASNVANKSQWMLALNTRAVVRFPPSPPAFNARYLNNLSRG
jgi:hypothetical protein